MYVTLGGGIAAAILDPIFIFGLRPRPRRRGDLDGAVALRAVRRRHLRRAFRPPSRSRFPIASGCMRRRGRSSPSGCPAVLTQLATPVGNAFVTAEIARFGDGAVAGWAIIGRIMPVAFGVDLCLVGRGRADHRPEFRRPPLRSVCTSTMRDSLTVTTVYVLAVWALLALFAGPIASLFGATGQARELIIFFCHVRGRQRSCSTARIFVSSAAFNNLGYPTYSTVFNWGRSTLGIIPFAWVGAPLLRRGRRARRPRARRRGLRHRLDGDLFPHGGRRSRMDRLPPNSRWRHCRQPPTRRSRPARRRRCSRLSRPCAAFVGADGVVDRMLQLVLDRRRLGQHRVDLQEIERAEAATPAGA